MNSARQGILAAGNWIVDHTKIIDVYPAQDALANILGETHGNGGSPYNLLIDLARLGASFPLEALGLIGDDKDGETIRADCRQHRINVAQLRTCSEAHTSYTDVMTVKATGRRTFFHQRGANAWLGPEHFDFGASRAKHFHLGYLLLLDRLDEADPEHGTVAAHLLKKALDAGFKTSIDVVSEDSDRFPAIVRPALKWTDYAILNEFEAERTTGRFIRTDRGVDFAQLQAAALDLLAAGVRDWVVIHFPEGAIAAHRDRDILFQGSARIGQDKIIATTGAGDAFGAGLLYGIHEGKSMEECLLYAVCVATACLTQATCSGGIHSLSQCLELGQTLGFRGPPSLFPLEPDTKHYSSNIPCLRPDNSGAIP